MLEISKVAQILKEMDLLNIKILWLMGGVGIILDKEASKSQYTEIQFRAE